MAVHEPLGIGLRNYESTYDYYDDTHGEFGTARSVHSSHFQVLAENGLLGFAAWVGCFLYAFGAAFRVRRRAREDGLSHRQQRFLFTTANALIVSMVSFLIGGAFVALALNDLTWMTFAMIAGLDRVSAHMLVEAEQRGSEGATSGYGPGIPASAARSAQPETRA
jgi:O-antigen ligase